MLTKSAFFALLNRERANISDASTIEFNASGSVLLNNPGKPNSFLSAHRYPATRQKAIDSYNRWLIEWAETHPVAAYDAADAAKKAFRKGVNDWRESHGVTEEQIDTACREVLEEKAVSDSRFPEVERMACISTEHISARNLDALNNQEVNRALPFWIVPTNYGWIVRFEAAVRMWGEQNDPDMMHPFTEAYLDDSFKALCDELRDAGFQVAHLDRDGPEIDGLRVYDHS